MDNQDNSTKRSGWLTIELFEEILMLHQTIFSSDLPQYDVATKIGAMLHAITNDFLCILKRGNTLRVFDWSSKTRNDVARILSSQPVLSM